MPQGLHRRDARSAMGRQPTGKQSGARKSRGGANQRHRVSRLQSIHHALNQAAGGQRTHESHDDPRCDRQSRLPDNCTYDVSRFRADGQANHDLTSPARHQEGQRAVYTQACLWGGVSTPHESSKDGQRTKKMREYRRKNQ